MVCPVPDPQAGDAPQSFVRWQAERMTEPYDETTPTPISLASGSKFTVSWPSDDERADEDSGGQLDGSVMTITVGDVPKARGRISETRRSADGSTVEVDLVVE